MSCSSLNKEISCTKIKIKIKIKNRKSVETRDGILLFFFFRPLFLLFYLTKTSVSHTRRNEVPEQKRKEKKPIREGKDEPSA